MESVGVTVGVLEGFDDTDVEGLELHVSDGMTESYK